MCKYTYICSTEQKTLLKQLQQKQLQQQSIYIKSLCINIYIYAAEATATSQTSAKVPLRASMSYCVRLCSHHLFYMLFSAESVTWCIVATWHDGRCCAGVTLSRSRVVAANHMMIEGREDNVHEGGQSAVDLQAQHILVPCNLSLDALWQSRAPIWIDTSVSRRHWETYKVGSRIAHGDVGLRLAKPGWGGG